MNLGENNNFFRESFRGFNKDDVAEYIAKLVRDYGANEERYKEYIAKLTMELKTKTDELSNFTPETENRTAQLQFQLQLEEIEQKHKDEISRLVNELNEKDTTISNLQIQLESNKTTVSEGLDASEILKYQELIVNLSKEIERLKEEIEKSESVQADQSAQSNILVLNETINQLSIQMAECESEKLYLLNMLKKIMYVLEIESVKDRNIEYALNISDIAPKTIISDEIDAGLLTVIKLKEKLSALESENADLKIKVEEKLVVLTDEQKIYESITADLGGVIYSAKKTAEDINAKAVAEAENIIVNAKSEAESIIGNAYAKKETVLEENRKNMAEFKRKYGFIKKEYEDMMQKYKEITENYMLHMADIEGIINIIYDKVNNEQ